MYVTVHIQCAQYKHVVIVNTYNVHPFHIGNKMPWAKLSSCHVHFLDHGRKFSAYSSASLGARSNLITQHFHSQAALSTCVHVQGCILAICLGIILNDVQYRTCNLCTMGHIQGYFIDTHMYPNSFYSFNSLETQAFPVYVCITVCGCDLHENGEGLDLNIASGQGLCQCPLYLHKCLPLCIKHMYTYVL